MCRLARRGDEVEVALVLQGWAIVDNTVGEDWNNVELSLVAGAPQSFIQNLSNPFYTRRPLVPLPEAVNLAPQTFESTLVAAGARLAGAVSDPSGGGVPGATVRVYRASGELVERPGPTEQGTTRSRLCPMVRFELRSSLPDSRGR